MRTIMVLLILILAGCINHNVTLYSPDGKTAVKCGTAVGQDEGGVCWHGYDCAAGANASAGCWTEQPL